MTRSPRAWASASSSAEILHRAVAGIDRIVIGDVVAIIPQRRGIKRQQPDRGDAQVGEIVEPLQETAEVADAIAIAVLKRFDVQLVDDGVFEPVRIGHREKLRGCASECVHHSTSERRKARH